MDASLPIVPTATLPIPSVRNGGEGATPFSQIPVVISKAEYIELRHQARYWKAQHLRATREITRLKQELQCQAAQIKAPGHSRCEKATVGYLRPRGMEP